MSGFGGSFLIMLLILLFSHLSVDSDFNKTIKYTGVGLMVLTIVFSLILSIQEELKMWRPYQSGIQRH